MRKQPLSPLLSSWYVISWVSTNHQIPAHRIPPSARSEEAESGERVVEAQAQRVWKMEARRRKPWSPSARRGSNLCWGAGGSTRARRG